jgi:hypothetical protein
MITIAWGNNLSVRLCYFYFFILSILMLTYSSMATAQYQETRVLVSLSTSSTVQQPRVWVKCYSTDFLYPEGINVYRREVNTLNWTKLNQLPILKKQKLAATELANDADLSTFVEIVKEAKPEDWKNEMLLFNVLLKSFQSNVFADYLGIFFEDTTAVNGITYEYRIQRIKQGREVLLGISKPIQAGIFLPEPPIDSLRAFQKDKSVGLNWLHNEEAYYGVNVYRKTSTDTAYRKLNTLPILLSQVTDSLGQMIYPDPMFSESIDLKENIYYDYVITGSGFFGMETKRSEPVRVFIKDQTPPLSPVNFSVKVDSMKVHLQWTNRMVDDWQGNIIYRSRLSKGPYEAIHTILKDSLVNSYTDTIAIPGPYYYYAAAVDASNNEAHSDLQFVEVQDVIPPSIPEELSIESDTGKFLLRWKKSIEPDLAGYYIYRTIDQNNKEKFVFLNAEPIKDNFFEQKLPANTKNRFYYFVVAVDTSYNRSKPSALVSAKMPDVLPPEKPFIKNIHYENDQIIINWVKNIDKDLIGYHLYRADTSMLFSRINLNMISRENFRYIDRNADINQDYYYYLVAYDSAGNASPPSNKQYAKLISAQKAAATTPITLKLSYKKRKKQTYLQWAYTNTLTFQGFVVYAGAFPAILKPISGLIKGKRFTEKEVVNNVDRYYQIRAYHYNGVINSSSTIQLTK